MCQTSSLCRLMAITSPLTSPDALLCGNNEDCPTVSCWSQRFGQCVKREDVGYLGMYNGFVEERVACVRRCRVPLLCVLGSLGRWCRCCVPLGAWPLLSALWVLVVGAVGGRGVWNLQTGLIIRTWYRICCFHESQHQLAGVVLALACEGLESSRSPHHVKTSYVGGTFWAPLMASTLVQFLNASWLFVCFSQHFNLMSKAL